MAVICANKLRCLPHTPNSMHTREEASYLMRPQRIFSFQQEIKNTIQKISSSRLMSDKWSQNNGHFLVIRCWAVDQISYSDQCLLKRFFSHLIHGNNPGLANRGKGRWGGWRMINKQEVRNSTKNQSVVMTTNSYLKDTHKLIGHHATLTGHQLDSQSTFSKVYSHQLHLRSDRPSPMLQHLKIWWHTWKISHG